MVVETQEEKIFDTDKEAVTWAHQVVKTFNGIMTFELSHIREASVTFTVSADGTSTEVSS